MDWNDPAQRLALIERIGADAYNKAFKEHLDRSVIETVNGYPIRPVQSRFGRIFMVDGTDMGFATLERARAYAAEQEKRK